MDQIKLFQFIYWESEMISMLLYYPTFAPPIYFWIWLLIASILCLNFQDPLPHPYSSDS